MTYTAPTWVGGNGFGASIDIKNTGPAINGWNLVFNFPNGQRIQNGWPVTFTQPAGSATVTASSNAPWNAALATNATFNIAFNGTFTGTNNPPTAFTLNGVACNGGGTTNTAPTVSITAPTAGQSFAAGTTSVNLAANAADAGGAVVRVEFRVDGVLVNTDTSAPYAFAATGLTAGSHSVTATAVDNGSPALSTTSTAVAFTIASSGNTAPTVSVTAPTAGQSFAAGTTSVNLAATAADPGGAVARVEFRVDGTLVNSDTSSPYAFTATGLTAGSHSVTATAVDNGSPALSTVSTAVAFTIASTGNTAPTVSLTAPTSGQSFAAGAAVTLSATAADAGGAVIRVEFRVDGTLVSSDTTSPYSFTATGLAAGSHTATATAFDNGTPTLSTATAAVPFTIGSSGAVFRVNTAGRITKNGTVFPVRCGNWFGLEGRHEPSTDATNKSGAPMEQYIGNTFWANGGAGTGRTIQQTMQEISGMGINMIRLPLVPQTLNANDPQGTGAVLKNHPSVRIANSRLALETMITAAAANNIAVLLDVHSCSNYVGWRKGRLDARPPYVDATRDNYDFTREDSSCSATNNPASVTRIQAYNQSLWLDNLRTLAGLGTQLGVDNIIGIDIFNEPWDYTWADWKSMAEAAYTAINAVNPNTLIFVEGISASANNQDGSPTTITQVPHGNAATVP
ncbi:MAG: Ig-like domain-containing protein, partial [Peristeroidobacter soli]